MVLSVVVVVDDPLRGRAGDRVVVHVRCGNHRGFLSRVDHPREVFACDEESVQCVLCHQHASQASVGRAEVSH